MCSQVHGKCPREKNDEISSWRKEVKEKRGKGKGKREKKRKKKKKKKEEKRRKKKKKGEKRRKKEKKEEKEGIEGKNLVWGKIGFEKIPCLGKKWALGKPLQPFSIWGKQMPPRKGGNEKFGKYIALAHIKKILIVESLTHTVCLRSF